MQSEKLKLLNKWKKKPKIKWRSVQSKRQNWICHRCNRVCKKNCKKSQFESARASVSNKKKNMNTITNLKDYIIDLKKKINADK